MCHDIRGTRYHSVVFPFVLLLSSSSVRERAEAMATSILPHYICVRSIIIMIIVIFILITIVNQPSRVQFGSSSWILSHFSYSTDPRPPVQATSRKSSLFRRQRPDVMECRPIMWCWCADSTTKVCICIMSLLSSWTNNPIIQGHNICPHLPSLSAIERLSSRTTTSRITAQPNQGLPLHALEPRAQRCGFWHFCPTLAWHQECKATCLVKLACWPRSNCHSRDRNKSHSTQSCSWNCAS